MNALVKSRPAVLLHRPGHWYRQSQVWVAWKGHLAGDVVGATLHTPRDRSAPSMEHHARHAHDGVVRVASPPTHAREDRDDNLVETIEKRRAQNVPHDVLEAMDDG